VLAVVETDELLGLGPEQGFPRGRLEASEAWVPQLQSTPPTRSPCRGMHGFPNHDPPHAERPGTRYCCLAALPGTSSRKEMTIDGYRELLIGHTPPVLVCHGCGGMFLPL